MRHNIATNIGISYNIASKATQKLVRIGIVAQHNNQTRHKLFVCKK